MLEFSASSGMLVGFGLFLIKKLSIVSSLNRRGHRAKICLAWLKKWPTLMQCCRYLTIAVPNANDLLYESQISELFLIISLSSIHITAASGFAGPDCRSHQESGCCLLLLLNVVNFTSSDSSSDWNQRNSLGRLKKKSEDLQQ